MCSSSPPPKPHACLRGSESKPTRHPPGKFLSDFRSLRAQDTTQANLSQSCARQHILDQISKILAWANSTPTLELVSELLDGACRAPLGQWASAASVPDRGPGDLPR